MSVSTLASEHTELLRGVRRRVVPILSLIDARVWPSDEIATLLRFVRAEVLHQLSAEEALLFPAAGCVAPLAELSADHLRLHRITDEIERVNAQPCPLPDLSLLMIDLVATLGHHLLEEEAVLAALADTEDDLPGIAELSKRNA